MFPLLMEYAYTNPIQVWLCAGVGLFLYLFVWPVLARKLSEYLTERARAKANYDEELRVARLKQADALRLATKIAENEKQPTKPRQPVKKAPMENPPDYWKPQVSRAAFYGGEERKPPRFGRLNNCSPGGS